MSIQSRRFTRSKPQTGVLLFDGRFTTLGTYTAASNGSGAPPAPWGSAEYVGVPGSNIKIYTATTKDASWWPDPFTAWGSNAGAFTSYNDNAMSSIRAQTHGGPLLSNGSEVYYSWIIYVPSSIGNSWPVVGTDSDWNVISQLHSPPYSTAPGCATSIKNYNGNLCLFGDNGSGFPTWYTTLARDRWIKITQHLIVHTVGGQGLLEVWVDGVKQQQILPRAWANYDTTDQYISADGTTAHIATEVKDTNGPGDLYINMYRKGMGSNWGMGSVTIFHMGMKIGTSYAIVQ